ncbi:hypothetical protein SAMN04487967_2515 [Natronorubrum sediminis]|uniref:Uncharacterized protein n=1 Tax=Natronorubrum sediminis TaxID=640943 RepID=A0A1H6FZM4_9EURY|nr:hypothetical protein SAMN04487967_2515 [Natronorubrum sediminis]
MREVAAPERSEAAGPERLRVVQIPVLASSVANKLVSNGYPTTGFGFEKSSFTE